MHLLSSTVRWVSGWAKSLYTAVGAFLTIGLSAAALTAALFALLARRVLAG